MGADPTFVLWFDNPVPSGWNADHVGGYFWLFFDSYRHYGNQGLCGLPPSCSNIDDACSATQKCCDPTLSCIAGFCALVVK